MTMGPGESWPALCLCGCVCMHTDWWDGLHWQLEQGCKLRGLYVQLSATGDTGIQGQLLGRVLQCLSPAPDGFHTVHVYIYYILIHMYIIYVYVHIYIHTRVYSGLTSGRPPCSARDGSRMRPLVLSVHMSALCVCLWPVWPVVYICIHVYAGCILLHVPTRNMSSASLLVEPRGAWNCSSLASLMLSDLAWNVFY